MADNLCEIVDSMYNLPPMPVVATKILEMLQKPDYTADSLAQLIACDPVLAGRLLAMANSAFYGVRREVKSLPRAVVILGENALKSLILAASLKIINRDPGPIQKRLWENSVGCALGAQMVARVFHSTASEEAFLGGLFRHIGKMVMLDFDGPRYQQLVAMVDAGEASQDRLEKELFQFSHAVIGAAVLEKWNFSKVIIQATLNHDRLELSPEVHPAAYRLAATVNIASSLCRVLGIGCAKPDDSLRLSQVPGALALGVEYPQMKMLLEQLDATYSENTGFFFD
jgi:HD-like signal output (HDOD) protein